MPATFTSFYFLCFYTVILMLYYLIPGKLRWGFLLAVSAAYYLLTGNGILILYPAAACLTAWTGMRIMAGTEDAKKRRIALGGVVAVLLGILFVLKYMNFTVRTIQGLCRLAGLEGDRFTGFQLLAPLGVSFYTLTVLGYVIDVYHQIASPPANVFRLFLYGMYFPAILSGPVLRYREEGEVFFEPHPLDYRQVTGGLQRMVWGFFKILVISERMNLIVHTVYGSYEQYPGLYIWFATFCFSFQLYTNFSGGMDIALGMSQTFGIPLPENFRTPFFSRSIQEYWRRWHITLGVWMKEYVFYPLLRSRFFTRTGKWLGKKAGKKKGRQLNTLAAMFVLWAVVGFWHGGDWKYVIGSGLLHWCYIAAGELLGPGIRRRMEGAGIPMDAPWMNRLRVLRTFFLVSIGFVFFRADSVGAALQMLRLAVTVWNPEVLWNGGLFSLGLDPIEMVIAVVSLLLLLAVSLGQEKGSVREWIGRQRLPVRFALWYALLFYIILLGYYGPGYSAVEFIYQGF